jgi:hypothetical protein
VLHPISQATKKAVHKLIASIHGGIHGLDKLSLFHPLQALKPVLLVHPFVLHPIQLLLSILEPGVTEPAPVVFLKNHPRLLEECLDISWIESNAYTFCVRLPELSEGDDFIRHWIS